MSSWVRNATASSVEGRGAGEAEPAPSPAPDAEAPRRRRHRPLYRRLFHYVRTAWTGVKFALDSELEELGEQLPRYRPDSIAALRRVTRFTEPELKRLYRGFKAECPTGVVKEDTFKLIYSQFFPQGANTAQYAHYVFNTLDQDRSGLLSFEEFVTGLSVLSRGSLEEKLRWTFSLYDINGDGCITKEEMTDIVTAIYDLMGRVVEPSVEDDIVQQKVERLFQKMDLNRDGVVTLDEFLDCCVRDEDISRSMGVFDSTF
ncbi:Kv channel-interacting protein 1-like [Cydia fagiglandana]|uniref:Kv channel-interacting protein 1-like n=1 Tax=Cydia fagiglandana TaxID=1458189 RepID=UPI002FEDE62B